MRADPEFVPAIADLATDLGVSRDTVLEYLSKPEFSGTVAEVLTSIEAWWEKRLASASSGGVVFWLKNRPGWRDKTETELTGTMNVRNLSEDELNAQIMAFMQNQELMQSIGKEDTS